MRLCSYILVLLLSFIASTLVAQEKVLIEPSEFAVDTLVDGETVDIPLKLTNTTDQHIVILGIGTRSMARFDWTGSQWIAPGKSGTVKFTFRPAMPWIDRDILIKTTAGDYSMHVTGISLEPVKTMTKGNMKETVYYHNGQAMYEYRTLGALYKGSSPTQSPYHGYLEWYRDGKLKMEATLEKGIYVATYYHHNGEKKAEGAFKGSVTDPEQQGLWIRYHSNGQKAAEGFYKNGVRKGVWQEWHANGALLSRAEYGVTKGKRTYKIQLTGGATVPGVGIRAKGKLLGSYPKWYEEYYMNGKRKYDFVFFGKNDGNGLFSAWYRDGQMSAQRFIKKEEKGVDRLWCRDGTALREFNSFRGLDTIVEPYPEGCEQTLNMLDFAPRLATGPLYDPLF